MSLRGAGLSLRDYVNDTFNRTCELVSVGLHPEPVISFEEWRARKRQASTTQGICLLSAELESTGELQEPLVPLAADTFRSVNAETATLLAPQQDALPPTTPLQLTGTVEPPPPLLRMPSAAPPRREGMVVLSTPPGPPAPSEVTPPPPPPGLPVQMCSTTATSQTRPPQTGTPPPPYDPEDSSEYPGLEMETSSQPVMQASYYQHKAAKLASFRPQAFNITIGNTVGTSEAFHTGNLGSFDNHGDKSVANCFNGSRDKQRGTGNTNQNISCSFDPSSMICITCTGKHEALPQRAVTQNNPVVFAFTDQNYPACLPSDNGECVRIVRLENSSLLELSDIALELFENSPPLPGTVMMYGSLSHLVRVGTSIYASQWVMLVNKVSIRWPGVKICPVPFILAHEIIGTAGKYLHELACWYSIIYSGDTQGLRNTWELLLYKVQANSKNVLPLPYEESYCIPLPGSLNSSVGTTAQHFVHTSSTATTVTAFSATECMDIVHSLRSELGRDFSVALSPQDNLLRAQGQAPADRVKDHFYKHIVVVGASNMRQTAPALRVKGASVHEVTHWGSVTCQQDVNRARSDILKVRDGKDVAVILDLFGNTAYRYEQQDGNLALPCKISGKYHLPGNISIAGDRAISSLISSARPLLELLPNSTKVILPALPRFVLGSCCDDPDHGKNTREEDHAKKMLSDLAHLRKTIRQKVSNLVKGKCWVMDPVTACIDPDCGNSTGEKIVALKQVVASDNVHFTQAGYANLGTNLVNCLTDIWTGKICKGKDTAEISVSGPVGSGPVLHHWKGFLSVNGATRDRSSHRIRHGHTYSDARARAHPYSKKHRK